MRIQLQHTDLEVGATKTARYFPFGTGFSRCPRPRASRNSFGGSEGDVILLVLVLLIDRRTPQKGQALYGYHRTRTPIRVARPMAGAGQRAGARARAAHNRSASSPLGPSHQPIPDR